MMLPKQVLPMFDLVIPSTGKKIQYRQLVVKEEKMMLQAQESDDIGTIINCVKEIIKSCTQGIDSVDDLTTFDVELLITRIRAKSMGEKIDLAMPCDTDPLHERIPVQLDLEKIEVIKFPDHAKNIKLWDDVGIIMRYPRLNDFHDETITKLEYIKRCIESIYTTETVYKIESIEPEELDAFLDRLKQSQIDEIYTKFFDNMPRFEHIIKYKCPACNTEHTRIIRGLASFFA